MGHNQCALVLQVPLRQKIASADVTATSASGVDFTRHECPFLGGFLTLEDHALAISQLRISKYLCATFSDFEVYLLSIDAG